MRLIVQDMSQGHVGRRGGGMQPSQSMHDGVCQTTIATSFAEFEARQ